MTNALRIFGTLKFYCVPVRRFVKTMREIEWRSECGRVRIWRIRYCNTYVLGVDGNMLAASFRTWEGAARAAIRWTEIEA